MNFSKRKLSFVASHEGQATPEGWLVLDVANMDLDGVTKIYVDMRDIDAVRAQGDQQAEALRKARELLGG